MANTKTKSRVGRRVAISLITLGCLVVGLGVLAFLILLTPSRHDETEMAQRALDFARLAKLPASATAIKADGTDGLFSGTFLLRFQAPAADIEAFLQQSPGLNGVTPMLLTPEQMCLPFPPDGARDGRHHCFTLDERYPWFDPTIRTRGRRFEVPQDANACGGEVFVDDETGTVFIRSHRS